MALERELLILDPRVPPTRGLILCENAKGVMFPLLDLRRWMRYSRLAHKTTRLDLFVRGDGLPLLPALLEYAAELDIIPSLRTSCATPPPDLEAFKRKGMWDVYISPESISNPYFEAWLDACSAHGLPVRVQILAPLPFTMDPEPLIQRLTASSAVVVNLAAFDPFLPVPGAKSPEQSAATIRLFKTIAERLEEQRIETSLLYMPFCLAGSGHYQRVVNSPQFGRDHQQYRGNSYTLAGLINNRGPIIAGKILLILLTRQTLCWFGPDNRILPWLSAHPLANARLAILRRLTRHMRILKSVPKAIPVEKIEDYENNIARKLEGRRKYLGPLCSKCSLWRICDHGADQFPRVLPGLVLTPQTGEQAHAPLHFSARYPKYYDAMDKERACFPECYAARGEEALSIIGKRPPTIELDSHQYGVECSLYEHMEGGVRWYSVTNSEKLSWPLGHFRPPFTIAVTFAGGIADYIGFSFGRHAKIMCPMEGHRHDLALHVSANGEYVLLRDGKPVRPEEFEGAHFVPRRLGNVLEPRISVWNIEDTLVTQRVRIWDGDVEQARKEGVNYSIVIVCSRYSRRLQAALNTIAHQQGFDLSRLEIIICYIPGIDPTDDILDSLELTWPNLRIIRSPFDEKNRNAKGFLINESVNMASGEWIVLMDADILLPPDMFLRVDAVAEGAHFIAPDGRKMLDKAATSRILLGEARPWESWDSLMRETEEYRLREARGVPIGFFQCVRTDCIKAVKYVEMEHFEYADMQFGMSIREKYGMETRLGGLAVLHMDHSGSQWYGTAQHK